MSVSITGRKKNKGKEECENLLSDKIALCENETQSLTSFVLLRFRIEIWESPPSAVYAQNSLSPWGCQATSSGHLLSRSEAQSEVLSREAECLQLQKVKRRLIRSADYLQRQAQACCKPTYHQIHYLHLDFHHMLPSTSSYVKNQMLTVVTVLLCAWQALAALLEHILFSYFLQMLRNLEYFGMETIASSNREMKAGTIL